MNKINFTNVLAGIGAGAIVIVSIFVSLRAWANTSPDSFPDSLKVFVVEDDLNPWIKKDSNNQNQTPNIVEDDLAPWIKKAPENNSQTPNIVEDDLNPFLKKAPDNKNQTPNIVEDDLAPF